MNTRKRKLVYDIANHYVNNYEGIRPADHFHGTTRYETALSHAIKDLKSLKDSERHLESAPLNKLLTDLKLINDSNLGIKPGIIYRKTMKNFKKSQAQGMKKRRKTKRRKNKRRKKLIKK